LLLVHSASADALDIRWTSGEPDSGVPLSEADIVRVIVTNRPAFKRCYEDARAQAPNLRVRLRLRIVIEGSGKISRATDEGSELPHDGVRACIADVLRRATFPRSGGPTHAIVPFNFVPPDPSDAGVRDAGAD
jgi:hypothetical protein